MVYSAHSLLDELLHLPPRSTAEAPRNARGIYGLVDHLGQLRYIGSTSSADQSLHERIHQRHRTGSEGMSHYLSHMYNTGRMWRDRRDASARADGHIAKALRNAFISDHCGAVWIVLPDDIHIAAVEREILAMAPAHAIAWNGRAMSPHDEPVDLVDCTIARLGWGAVELAAVERQRARHSANALPSPAVATSDVVPPELPSGKFRFLALDVETANSDRASICQIGIAGVRPDDTVVTWSSYVDPATDDWSCSRIHGITAATVQGAPTFEQLLPLMERTLAGHVVYQHSTFDSGAITAACRRAAVAVPAIEWRDSAETARRAWPELKGNGGHGLASLTRHLNLKFRHHHAGEDARASAEIVLHAEARLGTHEHSEAAAARVIHSEIQRNSVAGADARELSPTAQAPLKSGEIRRLGTTVITQGNIDNCHIYLRDFFHKFPDQVIGGSNKSSAAPFEVLVEWGGATEVSTDLDGTKKFFRKRRWIRNFFEMHQVVAGSVVSVDEIGHFRYRLTVQAR
jgi:DNA polymerase-3 subunit epsilon